MDIKQEEIQYKLTNLKRYQKKKTIISEQIIRTNYKSQWKIEFNKNLIRDTVEK